MPRRKRANIGRRSRSNARRAISRANRTDDQRATDNENSRIGMSELRSRATENEREANRLRMQRVRAHQTQRQRLRQNEHDRLRRRGAPVNLEAFRYDPKIGYGEERSVTIGEMSVVCPHCKALKFSGESPGLCCAGGKVKLPQLVPPPEPLRSLVSGTHQHQQATEAVITDAWSTGSLPTWCELKGSMEGEPEDLPLPVIFSVRSMVDDPLPDSMLEVQMKQEHIDEGDMACTTECDKNPPVRKKRKKAVKAAVTGTHLANVKVKTELVDLEEPSTSSNTSFKKRKVKTEPDDHYVASSTSTIGPGGTSYSLPPSTHELGAVQQLLTTLQKPVDEDQVFGDHVACELRALRNPHVKRRLKRTIMEAILDAMGEEL